MDRERARPFEIGHVEHAPDGEPAIDAAPVPFHHHAGVRMQSRSPFLALLAVIILATSLPIKPAQAAEPYATTLAPLPAVDTDDGRFGMVQGIVQPDLAWQAGA